MSATCGATAVPEDPLAVELGGAPRRVAEATGPRRRAAPAGERGVRISAFAVAPGGAGEAMCAAEPESLAWGYRAVSLARTPNAVSLPSGVTSAVSQGLSLTRQVGINQRGSHKGRGCRADPRLISAVERKLAVGIAVERPSPCA